MAQPPALPLTVRTVETSPERVLVVATGELDIATVGTLAEQLAKAVAGGCRHLDVDLTLVPFCDVVGFDVLLDTARSMRARQGTMRIIGPCWSLRYMAGTFGAHHLLGLPPGPTPAGGRPAPDRVCQDEPALPLQREAR